MFFRKSNRKNDAKHRTPPVVERLDSRTLMSGSIVGTAYSFQADENVPIGLGTPSGSPVLATFEVNGLPTGNLKRYSAKIAWSDGTIQTGAIESPSPFAFNDPNQFAVEIPGSKSIPTVGTPLSYDVTFSFDAGHGRRVFGTASGSAQITDIPLTTTGETVQGNSSGVLSNVTVAKFKAVGYVYVPTSEFSATITWGDGKTSAGKIVDLGYGNFGVVGSHAYGASFYSRTYLVSVEITGISSPTVIQASKAVIAPAIPPIVVLRP